MTVEDDILALMQLKGPVLPADVAKQIKTNILLASAYLSEIASRKKLKISSLKVGGSPVYFLQGQEEKLEKFASNLNEKDLRAYDMLKQKRVLRDSHMTPLMRVALRSIKDFAVPINVTFGNSQELFWKWITTTETEVNKLIHEELEGPKEESVQIIEKPAPELKETKRKKKVEMVEVVPLLDTKREPELTERMSDAKIQKSELLKKKKKVESAPDDRTASFEDQISSFFEQKGIAVLKEDIIAKGKEASYVVEIPSAMGMLRYLCKARNKNSTERDLSSAFVDGQLQKMPVVFLHTGKLNAKAQALVKTEPFKTMVLFKLTDGSKTQRSGSLKTDYA
ncbi:MAG TPA: hypothetical protein VJH88_04205 [Candidatus Nanoarchaeia archaeon]|nr:hypothetical protein [Candidatus Nanoarchaeia archaeon]